MPAIIRMSPSSEPASRTLYPDHGDDRSVLDVICYTLRQTHPWFCLERNLYVE